MIRNSLKKLILPLVAIAAMAGNSVAEDKTEPQEKKVLIVVANQVTAPTVGWPVGFWAAELTHPYHELEQAGYKVEIASPDGGEVFTDAYSDPRHESGYSAHDFVSLGFLESPKHSALLKNTTALSSIDAKDYAAIIVAGGQSPMFTFRENQTLQSLLLDFYTSGKPTAALCHGVAALIDLKDSKGNYIISGKNITGFTAEEDAYVDSVLQTKLFDWWIEPEALKRGAVFKKADMWQSFAVKDGNLITGQQQNSGAAVARIIINDLKAN